MQTSGALTHDFLTSVNVQQDSEKLVHLNVKVKPYVKFLWFLLLSSFWLVQFRYQYNLSPEVCNASGTKYLDT